MKKSLIPVLGAMLSLTALCAAELTDFPEKADWRDSPNLKALPEDVLVYPGHGPRTTVGNEKRSNPYLT